MKKIVSLLAVFTLVLVGCGSEDPITYYGESLPNENGEFVAVTYTAEGDDITSVWFDAYYYDEDGEYGEPGEMHNKKDIDYNCCDSSSWYDQVTEVETYIENENVFPTLDEDEIDADGVTGATIKLGSFEEAFNAAVAQ